MKKAFLLIAILLFSANVAYSQQNILFLLPGESSYVASRTYNIFKELYVGNSQWLDASKATKSVINNYNHVVKIEEFFDGDIITVKASCYLSTSTSTITKSFNLRSNRTYIRYASEFALDILNKIDPEYIEELKEIIEDL